MKQAQSDEGWKGGRSVDEVVIVSPNVPASKPARILASSFLHLFTLVSEATGWQRWQRG